MIKSIIKKVPLILLMSLVLVLLKSNFSQATNYGGTKNAAQVGYSGIQIGDSFYIRYTSNMIWGDEYGMVNGTRT